MFNHAPPRQHGGLIHAPARGSDGPSIKGGVSIHAPARGRLKMGSLERDLVQSTLPHGDMGGFNHAPARGDSGVLDAFSERVLEGGIENPKIYVFICYVCVKSGGDAFVEAIANLLGKSCSLGVRRIKLSRYLQDHKILLRLRVQLFFSN